MLKVDTNKDIRIANFVEGKGICEISRDFYISRRKRIEDDVAS